VGPGEGLETGKRDPVMEDIEEEKEEEATEEDESDSADESDGADESDDDSDDEEEDDPVARRQRNVAKFQQVFRETFAEEFEERERKEQAAAERRKQWQENRYKERRSEAEQEPKRKSTRLATSKPQDIGPAGDTEIVEEEASLGDKVVEGEVAMGDGVSVAGDGEDSAGMEGEEEGAETGADIIRPSCQVCGDVFRDEFNVERHRRQMHAVRPEPLPCFRSFCHRTFATAWEREVHKAECKQVCALCAWSTVRPERMAIHMGKHAKQ
jgi:hypothetical protein